MHLPPGAGRAPRNQRGTGHSWWCRIDECSWGTKLLPSPPSRQDPRATVDAGFCSLPPQCQNVRVEMEDKERPIDSDGLHRDRGEPVMRRCMPHGTGLAQELASEDIPVDEYAQATGAPDAKDTLRSTALPSATMKRSGRQPTAPLTRPLTRRLRQPCLRGETHPGIGQQHGPRLVGQGDDGAGRETLAALARRP